MKAPIHSISVLLHTDFYKPALTFGPLIMLLIYMPLWWCERLNSKFKQPPEQAHTQGM